MKKNVSLGFGSMMQVDDCFGHANIAIPNGSNYRLDVFRRLFLKRLDFPNVQLIALENRLFDIFSSAWISPFLTAVGKMVQIVEGLQDHQNQPFAFVNYYLVYIYQWLNSLNLHIINQKTS